MLVCHVCQNHLEEPLYSSPENISMTTMNQLIPGQTEVFFCKHCGHLQTTPLPDLETYYAQEYAINLDSDDDDQLYKIVDEKPIYRAQHQADIFIKNHNLAPGSRILDYGCAKSPTLRKIIEHNLTLEPYLFDVTDKYIPFWEHFPVKTNWSVHTPDPTWTHQMDVVLSFYALEHVADLQKTLLEIKNLLKPGGLFYFLVPNVYENTADFIVADHINHFSPPSLSYMLRSSGFSEIEIDAKSHEAAFIVQARYTPDLPAEKIQADLAPWREAALKVSAYWQSLSSRLQQFEADLVPDKPLAIYGAGFYGNLIASSLKHPERIHCFIDQNVHLQGREIHRKPILEPSALPEEIDTVLIGMNPRVAQANIAAITAWKNRQLKLFFL